MQFLYLFESGRDVVELSGDPFAHTILSRRERTGSEIRTRNLKDEFIYTYKIESITKKSATLRLQGQVESKVGPKKLFHLLWCVIDPKSVQKILPTLNEIGVSKISFIFCERSQKNFRLDFERLRRILISSCEQCGRSNLIELEEIKSLKEALSIYKDITVLDFGGEPFLDIDASAVLVGCEGGFSQKERELLGAHKKLSFDTHLILKSESAAVAAASKILL